MAESEAPHVRGFLFADLRAYTHFVETHGDSAAAELLSAYRTVVRAAVADFRGAEIRTEGDGFYVVFPSASSAIRCALAVLEQAASSTAAAGGPLPVGIGIHAGETADSAEGFVGSAVNIAARVCALAGPGELLITETVYGLVRTSMPLSVESRGRRHLKGIRQPIAVLNVRPTGAAPRSRGRRLRSLAARSLERQPLAAGFAALIGVAIVATVVLAIGLLANTAANPGAGPLRGPAGGGAAKASPSASENAAFPNAAEQALLARIDPAVGRLCRRAALTEYPVFRPYGDVETVPVRAGLRCPLGGSAPDFVFLWAVAPRFVDVETAGTFFNQRVSATKAQVGNCATDASAHMNWSFGLLAGRLICTASPARARIDWIYDGEDLIATAERDDGDRAALYQWWLETGRGILH
jgi:class 3 adenylate cyclase